MKTSLRVRVFSIKARMANLRHRHSDLKARIAEELKRPAPCSTSLQQLKRKRLKIKDEIASYEGLLRTIGASPSDHTQTA
ncbi:MAG: YdcH family protein [Roseovarius sp.]